jgi:putative transposase
MVIEAMLASGMSLRKALSYAGSSRNLYYYEERRCAVALDPLFVEQTRQIALRRPSYGTRRMAAQLSRELDRPVNRKRVQRVYRTLNWIEPSKKKREIIRSSDKVPKASRPYEVWEVDFTYVWCGVDGWGYLFNVFDVFSREWVAYVFDLSAVSENAVISVEDALISHKIKPEELTIRADNGSQYTSRAFRKAMAALKLKRVEHIARNTPEQNAHIESFHKTVKKEYLWPKDFQTYQEAVEALKEAFTDYNGYRIHSSLGYLTPYESLRNWFRMKKIKEEEDGKEREVAGVA